MIYIELSPEQVYLIGSVIDSDEIEHVGIIERIDNSISCADKCCICGDLFTPRKKGAMYCSAACKQKATRRRADRRISRNKISNGNGGAWVYLLQAGGTNHFKIGKAVDVRSRVSSIQTGSSFPAKIVHQVWCLSPFVAERKTHMYLSSKLIRGEWYDLDDNDVSRVIRMMNKLSGEDGNNDGNQLSFFQE